MDSETKGRTMAETGTTSCARCALKAIEDRVTRLVCHVEGIVTAAEIDELDRLRAIVGESWDAINGRWVALECEAGCGMKAVRGFRTCRWESCEQEIGK